MSSKQHIHDLFRAKMTSIDQFFDAMNQAFKFCGVSRRYHYDVQDENGNHREIDGFSVNHMGGNATQALSASKLSMNPSGWLPHDTDGGTIMWDSMTQLVGGSHEDSYSAALPYYQPADRKQLDPVIPHTWWWHREQVRIAMGIYPQRSQPMRSAIHAFGLQAYCIHPSADPEAPFAVSYTPDATMGKADRQLRVSSLGKLLRKLVPLLTDEHVGKLEAAHRAEMDPTFESVWTESEIVTAYTSMKGDTGCMRYDNPEEKWGLAEGQHPAMVYATGSIGVAFHRNGAGEQVSRALIFTKPDGTKGFLRVYGDQALRTKLQRAGYNPMDLSGMKVRAIPHAKYADIDNEDAHDEDEMPGPDNWLMPYIDGVDGNQSNYDGTWAYRDSSDPDHLQMITADQAGRLRSLFGNEAAAMCKDHSGVRAYIKTVTVEKWTCAITGKETNVLLDDAYDFWNGTEVVRVTLQGIRDLQAEHQVGSVLRFDEHGNVRSVSYKSNDAPLPPKFQAKSGDWYLDDETTRVALGYLRLDPEAYPNDAQSGEWFLPGNGGEYCEIMRNGTKYAIRKADAGYLVVHEDNLNVIRLVHLPADVAKGMVATGQWVQTLVHHGLRTLAAVGHPQLVDLRSGRKAIITIHEVVRCFDGTWSTPRMVNPVRLFGVVVHVPNDMRIDFERVLPVSERHIALMMQGRDPSSEPRDAMNEWKFLMGNHFDTGANVGSLINDARRLYNKRIANMVNALFDGAYITLLRHEDDTYTVTMQPQRMNTTFLDVPNIITRIRAALAADRVTDAKARAAAKLLLQMDDWVTAFLAESPQHILSLQYSYWGCITEEAFKRLMKKHYPETSDEAAASPA